MLRSSKRKNVETLAAMDTVKYGDSIREASADFNVPKSTLGHHISGRTDHGSNCGPDQIIFIR